MPAEREETRNYAELTGLNRAFLQLITQFRSPAGQSVFGLEPAVAGQLRALNAEQLDQLATTPGLLACFVPPDLRVADAPVTASPDWQHAAGVYVSALLTYLWQTEDEFLRAVIQPLLPGCDLRTMKQHFSQIITLTDRAILQLRARFHDHPSFWSDLIRSVRLDDPEFCALSRLTYIPLALTEDSC